MDVETNSNNQLQETNPSAESVREKRLKTLGAVTTKSNTKKKKRRQTSQKFLERPTVKEIKKRERATRKCTESRSFKRKQKLHLGLLRQKVRKVVVKRNGKHFEASCTDQTSISGDTRRK